MAVDSDQYFSAIFAMEIRLVKPCVHGFDIIQACK